MAFGPAQLVIRTQKGGKKSGPGGRRGPGIASAAEGASTKSIAEKLGIEASTVSRWRGRFAHDGLGQDLREAFKDEQRSGRPRMISEPTRMQVVATACDPLPDADGLSGWTLDLLVEEFDA